MPEGRTFTEAEHQAVLQGAIEREVAAAVKERDGAISELESKVEVLEAEKAALEQAKTDLQGEYDSYKEGIEQAKVVEQRKAERVERLKAAAIHVPDDYFTDERAQRWAEMADDQFEALVGDFEDVALAGLTPEEAKELEGLQGEPRVGKLTELRARRQEKAQVKPGSQVRETAAFSGGRSPSAGPGDSVVGQFFAARRGTPITTR